jgi:hypothetical protein
MSITTDPNDPRLGYGSDNEPGPQNEVYLVLSDEERAKGFVRPLRMSYKHMGEQGPKYPLQDTADERVKFEKYPDSESPVTGRYWNQTVLDNIGNGCGAVTTMGRALAETYARDPQFYGATYCAGCGLHKPVSEFVWVDDGSVVGS